MTGRAELQALLPFPLGSDEWEALRLAYATPERHYHTLGHVLATLVHAAPFLAAGRMGPAAAHALLWHDAVYDVSRHDNEAESARLARPWAARLGLDPGRVSALVEATAKHGALSPDELDELDEETALLLDCDLAVLAAPAPVYDRYEAGVRAEYLRIVPAELYEAGRRAFLEGLAARPRLFLSDELHAAWHDAAVANLRRALAATAAPS